jgi:hypothetical protein
MLQLFKPVQLVVTEPAVVVVVVLPSPCIPNARIPHCAVTGGVPVGVLTLGLLSNASTPRTHEFAFAVVIDKVGELAAPVPVFVVGIGLVWSTPDRETAPPATPLVPVVPLRVTTIVLVPATGFVRYQMEDFS